MARTKGTVCPRTTHELRSGRMPIEKALYEKWWRDLRQRDVVPDRFVWKTCTMHLLLKCARNSTLALPRELATRICDLAWLAFAGSASGWYSLESQRKEAAEAEADAEADQADLNRRVAAPGSPGAASPEDAEDPDAMNDEEFDAAIDDYYACVD